MFPTESAGVPAVPVPSGAVDPNDATGTAFSGTDGTTTNRQVLADAVVNGKFAVFGRQQELMAGLSYQHVAYPAKYYSLLYPGTVQVNVFNFNPADYPQPAVSRYPSNVYSKYGQSQLGGYATLRSELLDGLHSILGVRYASYKFDYVPQSYNPGTGALLSSHDYSYENNGILTPYGGLTYDLTKTISLYASYAKIFSPQGYYVTVTGAPLQPVTGKSYEVGAKGSWLDGTLTASVAIYDAKRENSAVLAGTNGAYSNAYCCYIAASQVVSKGVDLELNGELLKGWQWSGGYTYNLNEYTAGDATTNGTSYNPQMPKHLLKLWTMAQLPGRCRIGAWAAESTRSRTTTSRVPPPTSTPRATSQGPIPIDSPNLPTPCSLCAANITSAPSGLRRSISTTCSITPTIRQSARRAMTISTVSRAISCSMCMGRFSMRLRVTAARACFLLLASVSGGSSRAADEFSVRGFHPDGEFQRAHDARAWSEGDPVSGWKVLFCGHFERGAGQQ